MTEDKTKTAIRYLKDIEGHQEIIEKGIRAVIERRKQNIAYLYLEKYEYLYAVYRKDVNGFVVVLETPEGGRTSMNVLTDFVIKELQLLLDPH